MSDNGSEAVPRKRFFVARESPYGELTGQAVEGLPAPSSREVLCSLLEPYDVEDLVLANLQVERGYLVMPKSRRTDNRTYEWSLIERETGKLIPVSVKTGTSAVDISELASTAKAEGNAIANSIEDRYDGEGQGCVESACFHPNADTFSSMLRPVRARRGRGERHRSADLTAGIRPRCPLPG